MTVVSYVACERASVRIVERPHGWAVTINGEISATRDGFAEAWYAATDLAKAIDDHELEVPRWPKPRA
jgi:hypothetical protein